MDSWQELVLAAGIVSLAGLVRGFSGFGSALIMSPALSLLFGPPAAIASISLIDLPAVLYLLPEARRHAEWRSIVPMGLAGVAAIPLGAWLLVSLDPDLMRRAIGLVVLAVAALLALGWRYRGRAGFPLTAGIGASSGLLGGAMGISGPPIIIFYLSGPSDARTARASIIGFFLFTTAMTLATYASYHLYDEAVLWRAAWLIPAYFGGVWVGSRLFGVVSEAMFRRVALLLLVGIALAALIG